MTQTTSVDITAHAERAVTRPQFADTMARLASTVCVVSSGSGSECLGRTATAVFSLSANPPSIVVSIKADSALADTILKQDGFSLAMLAQGQELVADAFAGRVAAASRYLVGIWADWPSGRPRLLGAAAGLDCVLSASILVSDHRLFVGTIIATETAAYADPLLWSERQYQALERPTPFAATSGGRPLPSANSCPTI
ncbi:flavin reductase family protein [Ensifer sp. Root142]|uniref:flavin reductase family protein n=1 Tax=Ensifer sp. Root142 TaxID=1736461 RepID=UPI0007C909FC|nr:flavin reductase family protein [Ensifer sp. Root142]MDP9632150.1 flavin reductase [Ensifer adhaerens]